MVITDCYLVFASDDRLLFAFPEEGAPYHVIFVQQGHITNIVSLEFPQYYGTFETFTKPDLLQQLHSAIKP